jgi:hypothetical protein
MSKGRAKVCLCEPLDRYRRQVWTFIAHLLNCWATTFTGSGTNLGERLSTVLMDRALVP